MNQEHIGDHVPRESVAQVGDCQRADRWYEVFADLTASHAIEAKRNIATGPGASSCSFCVRECHRCDFSAVVTASHAIETKHNMVTSMRHTRKG